MHTFRKFALWTTAATYFLVFVGALVRVSGAGLGCPDWPRCFGRWMPPTSVSQLPPDIDPASFNITLAWIEYINRLVGVTVGFLILGVAILALRHFRRNLRVLLPTLAAAFLVAVQGWQGSQVVSSTLEPFVVTIHMVLALLITSLLIYATLESYTDRETPDASVTKSPGHIAKLAGVLWVVTIVQIVLGSQVRQALEAVAGKHPDWTGAQWFSEVGAINDLHLIFGVLVAGLTLYTGLLVLRTGGVAVALRRTVWGMIVLVVLQVGSGLILLVSGVPALSDLFHLWFAALFLGLVLVLFSTVRRPRSFVIPWETGLGRVAVYATIAILVLGIGAWLVIKQAEQSVPERSNSASYSVPVCVARIS